MTIDWPYETRLANFEWDDGTKSGKHLLYLIERPTVIFYF